MVDVVFADLTIPALAPDPAAAVAPRPAAALVADGELGMLAARVLRGGGILAVLTAGTRTSGPPARLVDPTGAVVASAQNADLLYLQHIVVPTGPLRPPASTDTPGDRGDTRRSRADGGGGAGHIEGDIVGRAAAGHVIAHADLLVFAQPRAYGVHTRCTAASATPPPPPPPSEPGHAPVNGAGR